MLLDWIVNGGVWGLALKWFESFFLSNKKQKGKINDVWSENIMEIDISVLGVILFLVYINELPATDHYKIIFADDSTCLAKDRNLCVLKTYLETEIQETKEITMLCVIDLNT